MNLTYVSLLHGWWHALVCVLQKQDPYLPFQVLIQAGQSLGLSSLPHSWAESFRGESCERSGRSHGTSSCSLTWWHPTHRVPGATGAKLLVKAAVSEPCGLHSHGCFRLSTLSVIPAPPCQAGRARLDFLPTPTGWQ